MSRASQAESDRGVFCETPHEYNRLGGRLGHHENAYCYSLRQKQAIMNAGGDSDNSLNLIWENEPKINTSR